MPYKYYKMTIIEYYRKMFVDHNNTTPSESRYDNNNVLSDHIYFPLGNKYFNKYNKQLINLPFVPMSKICTCEKESFIIGPDRKAVF